MSFEQTVLDQRTRLEGDKNQKIVQWLSDLNFWAKQDDAFERRQDGTGQWLLEDAKFQGWIKGDIPVLWCSGDRISPFFGVKTNYSSTAGVGKTILAYTKLHGGADSPLGLSQFTTLSARSHIRTTLQWLVYISITSRSLNLHQYLEAFYNILSIESHRHQRQFRSCTTDTHQGTRDRHLRIYARP